jgi:hypothetical protein
MAQGSDDSYTQMQMTDLPVPEEFKTSEPKNEKFWRTLNSEAKSKKDSFFIYFKDEPSQDLIKEIIPYLKKIKSWAPDLKFLLTTNWTQELDSLIDIWCPNLALWNQSPYPSPQKYLKKDFWIYTSCSAHGCVKNEVTGIPDLIIDQPSSFTYSFPWVAEAIGAKGILYYDTVRAYQESSSSPWRDPKIFNGMGEGNLFYPCPVNVCSKTNPEVFPSLRLKILQSSLQSLEIYKLALPKKKELKKMRESLVHSPRFWSKEIKMYEELKKRSLEILDAN